MNLSNSRIISNNKRVGFGKCPTAGLRAALEGKGNGGGKGLMSVD